MSNRPKFSIVLPARNEAKIINRALFSFEELREINSNFELLLGNDNSEDATSELMHSFALGKNWVKVYEIEENQKLEGLQGKTGVLDILIQNSSGDYIIFTDADMRLSKTWLDAYEIESNSKQKIGVWVGTSGFDGNDILSRMQDIEWLNALGLMHVLSKFDIPTTGMGNNMMISRKAYLDCGGYQKIGFSIVEDYLLYNAIIKQGYGFKHIFNKEIISYTLSPQDYLNQRIRWMAGGLQSESNLKYAGLLNSIWLPIVILIYFISSHLSITLLISGVSFNSCLFCFSLYRIQRFQNLFWFPLYLLYSAISWPLILILYLFRRKIIWKNRRY